MFLVKLYSIFNFHDEKIDLNINPVKAFVTIFNNGIHSELSHFLNIFFFSVKTFLASPGVHVVVVAPGRVVCGCVEVHRQVGRGRRYRTRKRVDYPDERGRKNSGLTF